jgi:hypothetical protein
MDFLKILELLERHEVQFIVVGGVGAVLQGAPINTFDLDIVHARDARNVERLESALIELGAYYRAQPSRRLRPARSHLESPGRQNLITNLGPLDVLGSIGHGRTYESLVEYTVPMRAGAASVLVLDLATLIAAKEETAGEKDRAVLPLLKAALARRDGG